MYKFNKIQKEFLEEVVNRVAIVLGKKEASQLVKTSAFIKTLYNDPSFAMYYPPDYWAGEIMNRAKIAV